MKDFCETHGTRGLCDICELLGPLGAIRGPPAARLVWNVRAELCDFGPACGLVNHAQVTGGGPTAVSTHLPHIFARARSKSF